MEGLDPRAKCCGVICRKRKHRFLRHVAARERGEQPLTITVADPPYPGRAELYRGHPDYAGEVDHDALVSLLEPADGWALATAADCIPLVIEALTRRRMAFRIAAWVRGPRPQPRARALSAWEPVFFRSARPLPSHSPPSDALWWTPHARAGDPDWIIGSKPGAWWDWVFALTGARAGDTFTDLYPGSGGGSRAWAALDTSPACP